MDDQFREKERQVLRKKLVSLLPFDRDQSFRVLDVGAGTGSLTHEVAASFLQVEVVCLDFSEVMLGHAKERLRQSSDRVTFVQSDLSLPNWTEAVEGNFDAIVSTLVFHTVPLRTQAIYSDIFPMVKAGGCFFSGDHASPSGQAAARIYRKAELLAYQARTRQ